MKEVTMRLPWLILYFTIATVAVVAKILEVHGDLRKADETGDAAAMEQSESTII
jgi:hypothetical protein